MKQLGMITKVVPVLKFDGKFIRNPTVITDRYVEDGEVVYGEPKTGEEAKKAEELVKSATVDLTLLDQEVNKTLWTLANLFPGCVIKAVNSIRAKKKYFWDMAKDYKALENSSQ